MDCCESPRVYTVNVKNPLQRNVLQMPRALVRPNRQI
jgi:hypothetical protein